MKNLYLQERLLKALPNRARSLGLQILPVATTQNFHCEALRKCQIQVSPANFLTSMLKGQDLFSKRPSHTQTSVETIYRWQKFLFLSLRVHNL